MVGQDDVFLPIAAIKSVQYPKELSEKTMESVQLGTLMMDYLRSLASVDMEQNQKKRRYYLVMNFMDFVHNFDLELTLFFNNNYEVDFSLQKLVDYIKDGNIS